MSEAMTNSDIEDVLSSIRRLVSQEGGRQEVSRTEPGRLILTAAQRVDAPPSGAATPAETTAMPGADLRQLEATIAELEAAVSASGSGWEPDGSEPGASAGAAAPSNVTALYTKPSFVHRPVVADPAPQENVTARPVATPPAAEIPQSAPGPSIADDAVVDEPAGIEETVIDEAMLRALVAQMVREELHGQLGERVTLQVRKLVRAEIARVLDERKMI